VTAKKKDGRCVATGFPLENRFLSGNAEPQLGTDAEKPSRGSAFPGAPQDIIEMDLDSGKSAVFSQRRSNAVLSIPREGIKE